MNDITMKPGRVIVRPRDYSNDLSRVQNVIGYKREITEQITKITEYMSKYTPDECISEQNIDTIFQKVSEFIELSTDFEEILKTNLRYENIRYTLYWFEDRITYDLASRSKYIPIIEEILVEMHEIYNIIWRIFKQTTPSILKMQQITPGTTPYMKYIELPKLYNYTIRR